MKLYGAALDSGIQNFLKAEFDLSRTDDIFGIPIFENERECYIGGHKGFYTLIEDADTVQLEQALSRTAMKKNVSLRISCEPPLSPGRTINHVLTLPGGTLSDEERLMRYGKKTRNQVRRAREGRLRVDVVDPDSVPWYGLYVTRIRQLGSIPKEEKYFELLHRSCAPGTLKLICAWDGDTLAGFNYAVCVHPYLVLTQSASAQEYWGRYVNDLLYDETVRFGTVNGYTHIDFGVSSLGDRTHNHFKEGFAGRTHFFIEPHVPPFLRWGRIARDITLTKAQSLALKLRGK